ncbi:hypothetical protein WAI98_20405, partial [Acinetobacter baumannii]
MPIMALIKDIPFFQGYKEYLRQALLLYIYLLTLAQVYALLATLIPNIKMLIDLARAKSSAEVLRRNCSV